MRALGRFNLAGYEPLEQRQEPNKSSEASFELQWLSEVMRALARTLARRPVRLGIHINRIFRLPHRSVFRDRSWYCLKDADARASSHLGGGRPEIRKLQ
jgi:hypothetical protein